MTALRYKRRAEIYSSLLSENSKKIIALANQKTIDQVYYMKPVFQSYHRGA